MSKGKPTKAIDIYAEAKKMLEIKCIREYKTQEIVKCDINMMAGFISGFVRKMIREHDKGSLVC